MSEEEVRSVLSRNKLLITRMYVPGGNACQEYEQECDSRPGSPRRSTRMKSCIRVLVGLLVIGFLSSGSSQEAIEPARDPRLKQSVSLFEPAIPLGQLLERLTQHHKVVLIVASDWSKVRVAVAVQERPLWELLVAIERVFEPLRWRRVDLRGEKPRYKLEVRGMALQASASKQGIRFWRETARHLRTLLARTASGQKPDIGEPPSSEANPSEASLRTAINLNRIP